MLGEFPGDIPVHAELIPWHLAESAWLCLMNFWVCSGATSFLSSPYHECGSTIAYLGTHYSAPDIESKIMHCASGRIDSQVL